MDKHKEIVPVWFFIGVLITIYGIIILIAGIKELSHPPAVVLAKYHSGLWGGLILLMIGGLYTFFFWPGRGQTSETIEAALPKPGFVSTSALPNSGFAEPPAEC